MKKVNEAGPAAPVAPRNIGQDYVKAKALLSKLVQAFTAFETKMTASNQILQQRLGPIMTRAAGTSSDLQSAQERYAQLDQEFKELQTQSKADLAEAQKTIKELRAALEKATQTSALDSDKMVIHQQDIARLTQEVAAKATHVERLESKLTIARERLVAAAQAHSSDKETFARTLDVYEQLQEKYKQEVASITTLKDQAVDKYNEFLGKNTLPTPEHVQNYGKFDLLEHLAKAKKKDKKNAADW